MNKIKSLMIVGMFASVSPLMAAELTDGSATSFPAPSAVSSVTAKTFLQVSDTQSLTEMQVGKILDFASQLYRQKLKKSGFVRDLKKSVDAQCAEAKKYAKNIAKQLGISENDFNILFRETETLLRQASISNADETLKSILSICVRASSSKIEARLADAGIDPLIQEVVGMVAVQSLQMIANKVPANGCCGRATRTLLDVVQATQSSTEPVA
ncbi:MAG TPA: hypothetical protein DIC42_01780 [Holosporales bacterium]|nr:hypothetical protein [Holosporales bacterium]